MCGGAVVGGFARGDEREEKGEVKEVEEVVVYKCLALTAHAEAREKV